MNTPLPAAPPSTQTIATIVPDTGTARQPAEQVVAPPTDQIASGHYGPQGHNPESNGKLPGASSDSGINAHPPGVKRCPECLAPRKWPPVSESRHS